MFLKSVHLILDRCNNWDTMTYRVFSYTYNFIYELLANTDQSVLDKYKLNFGTIF